MNLSPMAIFLTVLSVLYGIIIRLRNNLYIWRIIKAKELPCCVISIGNITVGGTGKTPMTIHVAGFLQKSGYNVVVISRGYKGVSEKTGGIISDGNSMLEGSDTGGDEPFMMAVHLKGIPVLVGKNRFMMGMLAKRKFNPDIIILDDAFQHLKLKRDINLVLLDNTRPLGNGYMLPRGTLREPVIELGRGDAYVMTRSDQTADYLLKDQENIHGFKLKEIFLDRPIFKTFHTPYYFKVDKEKFISFEKIKKEILSDDFTFLKERNVMIFSGIAKNDHFRRTVESFKCHILDFFEYSDHYHYSDTDLDQIVSRAQELKADYIITTEKDYTRIYKRLKWPINLVVIGVKITFEDEMAFQTYIVNRIDKV